ncbi:UNVERIFIED_CONTAM: UDP-glucuronate:xylan alpha-glucuronosyltransferase 1 [Sesamum latifolium]|uniref:Hexosyltransferase n=1 Tax=Sesamum latifolium TaxID=2727402 RepID=A0AAW2X7L9_9LAMI
MWLALPAVTELTCVNRDDAYKRKLQRIKVRSVENPFNFVTGGKNAKWKFQPLKLVLIIVVLGVFFAFLSSPTVCHQNSTSHTVSRWIWGGSDPRYISDLDISWEEILTALNQLPDDDKIQRVGLLNFNKNEIHKWQHFIPDANHTILHLDYADKNLMWESLYPEWIDEVQENEVPSCPSLPNPEVPRERLDLIAVKLPCQKEGNWSRDIARLHLQIAAANLAASCKGIYPVHVLFVTSCFPVPNLFTCKDLVAREGKTWLYKPNLTALREKLSLPIGSCELALPLGGVERDYSRKREREAYATILHSAYVYVCGAIVAAQSIRMSGSTRDLVILVDKSISDHHRNGLELAGWQVRTIERIRNPKAEKEAYNEWNYSKFRLWQLTDYDKIIFIDADMLILRNIDFLFSMPEISATGNNGPRFNSGVMVIEPSNSTFELLMDHINEIESYNGGDQGYLNEIFTWWHRIPRHMNFLKHFWIGDDEQVRQTKVHLFEAEPPILYVLHYLGNKPWVCFRDYDCNWNVEFLQEFASDVAHRTWWKVHDMMPEKLQRFCMLKTLQKAQLEWDRREAEKANYSDGHWRIRIRDERLIRCIDQDCSWQGMLRHWGEHTPPASL